MQAFILHQFGIRPCQPIPTFAKDKVFYCFNSLSTFCSFSNKTNVVNEATVEKLKLTKEPHPEPYQVAWINGISIKVTERYWVIFHNPYIFTSFIWYDVILMTVVHFIESTLAKSDS